MECTWFFSMKSRALRLFAGAAVVCGMSLGAGAVNAGLINGSFENETSNGVGGNTPTGWTLTGNAFNFWTGGNQTVTGGITAQSGNWFATFADFTNGVACWSNRPQRSFHRRLWA